MACEESRTIPPEIIAQILCRLPSKSIGRFRSVSKEWLSLLTDPRFIKTHQNTLNQHHLILISDHLSLKSIPTHLNNHQQQVFISTQRNQQLPTLESILLYTGIYGSCNGLILVSVSHFDLNICKLVVLNPTTGEFIELPKSGYEAIDNYYPESKILFGFGCDCVTDDYKVVTISYLHYVHVYSLRTNTWTRVTEYPYGRFFDEEGECVSGVFVNGFLHWIANKKGGSDDDYDDDDHGLVIVAFSLALETFTELSPPLCNEDIDVDDMVNDYCRLADLGGKLAIFLKVEGVVWLMTEYGVRESWTKISLHGFEHDSLLRTMVFYDNNGKILVARYGEVMVYDIQQGRFSKTIKIFRSMVKGTNVESLVSPKLNRTN